MIQEFKKFALRGNVVDMAVGIIIGAAFGAIVKGLVDSIIMPPIGLLLGGMDFSNLFILLKTGTPAGPYASLAEAKAAGAVTIDFGAFINLVINFFIIALVLFFVIRVINRLHKEAPPAPTTKECPYCFSTISLNATRCAHCTSELPKPGKEA
jgi:large conductance mechanosensitive channel